ncbi:MAG: response regulator transcription factor [Chloroflexota bacterium]
MKTITVLLVDDHRVVREGVKAMLSIHADIEVVGGADSGAEAILLAKEHAPDVVLMDLIMPEMDGVEATRQVRAASPDSKVIVLTSYHQDEHIFPAIRAGAISYLLKDIEPDALADAIRRAAEGEAVLHPRIAARVVQELHGTRKEDVNPFIELSEREIDVLKLIADGKSNADIAEQLVISTKTVKRHVSNILSKLHLGDRTQAAVYAWREGMMRKKE